MILNFSKINLARFVITNETELSRLCNWAQMLIFCIFPLIIFQISCDKTTTEANDFKSADWQTATPETQGVDAIQLNLAFKEADRHNFIHGIVIIRNGFLIGEDYFNGFDRNDTHNIRSVSKSTLSALIGIALRENYLTSLDEKIINYYPEYQSIQLDPGINDITIRHLLTMRAGFNSDHNIWEHVFHSSNWMKSTLQLVLVNSPGEGFIYSTAGTHLLSGIITKSTGLNTKQFAREYLLNPGNMSVGNWDQDPQGYYFGGSNVYSTCRDLARFGYLYLQNGYLFDQQIVPEDWVVSSLTDYRNSENLTWGDLDQIGYGYLWWMGSIKGFKTFVAIGHGGQFIFIFPELNLIVTTISNSNNLSWEAADMQERSAMNVVADYILPAVSDKL